MTEPAVRVGASTAALLFVLVAAVPAMGADEAELEKLREAILESRERVADHELEERQLFDGLESLAENLDRLSGEVSRARSAAKSARKELASAEAKQAESAALLASSRAALSTRAVALYKAGDAGPVQMLFAATSLRDFLSRFSVLKALVEHDAQLVSRNRTHHDAYAEAQRAAAAALERRDRTSDALQKRQALLVEERRGRTRLLARVRKDRVQERALLIELERAAKALEETLAALGDDRGKGAGFEGTGFSALKGGLERPVRGKIAQSFGKVIDKEFQTQTFRKGVEFDAPIGRTVAAVAPGRVRFSGWFRGYGRIVIIDHGDEFFTVSGHLSETSVEVGDGVERGDPIGAVGETGTLSGPSLYFELRRGSEPLNPTDWFGSSGR